MKFLNHLVLKACLLLMPVIAFLPVEADDIRTVNNQDTPKTIKAVEDLPNFHEVHPFLYRSGQPTEAGLKKLQEMGVKTIIDLRAPSEQHFDEKAAAGKLGLKYIRLVMTSEPPDRKQVDTFISAVIKAKNGKNQGSVLVHCAHGSDRTGCLVGIWRVSQEDWSYADAYKEMRKYWFTPKFTRLAQAVKDHAKEKAPASPETNEKENR